MRLKSALFSGLDWDARLTSEAPDSADGIPVVVLSNSEVLSPSDATFGEFKIVAASEEERRLLTEAGYTMADWTEEDEAEPTGEAGSPSPRLDA